MTPLLNNRQMDVLAGSSWVRQFVLTQPQPGNTAQFVGNGSWGAEFILANPEDPAEVYAVGSVCNNKCAWVAEGILWVSFSQVETVTWTWRRAAWYLDLIAPNTLADPFGYRDTVLRGLLFCEPRSIVIPNIYPTSRV